MQKDYIKKLVLGLLFPVVLNMNANASDSYGFRQDEKIRKSPFSREYKMDQNPFRKGCDSFSWSSFNGACQSGNFQKAEELIRCGADIDARNDEGDTALMIASLAGRLNVVQFLIEAGADIDLRNNEGETALMLARKYSKFYRGRHAEIERLLINNGADQRGLDAVKVKVRPSAPRTIINRNNYY